MKILLSSAIVLIGVVGAVYGLACYECEYNEAKPNPSLGNRTCLDEPIREKSVSCKNPDNQILHCFKFTASADDKPEVIRGCSALESEKEECGEFEIEGRKGNICYCHGNKCNGASAKTISAILLPLLAISFYAIL